MPKTKTKAKFKPITTEQLGKFMSAFAQHRNVEKALKLARISEVSIKSKTQTLAGQMVQKLINEYGDSYEDELAVKEGRKMKHKKRRKLTSELVESDE